MTDAGILGTIAELGVGLAGFSGIALVLTRGGAELTRLEADRLGIMLGSSLGATFLALLALVLDAFTAAGDTACRIASAVMAAYTAGFLRYYVTATLKMRAPAPELVRPLPFGSAITGHAANLLLQGGVALGLVACAPAFLAGLVWLLFHGAYQFGRILFIRPRRGAQAESTTPLAPATRRPDPATLSDPATLPDPATSPDHATLPAPATSRDAAPAQTETP